MFLQINLRLNILPRAISMLTRITIDRTVWIAVSLVQIFQLQRTKHAKSIHRFLVGRLQVTVDKLASCVAKQPKVCQAQCHASLYLCRRYPGCLARVLKIVCTESKHKISIACLSHHIICEVNIAKSLGGAADDLMLV